MKTANFFNLSNIKTLEDLKKEYFKLAKVYHPDKGGSKEEFQFLQNEYELLQNKILSGNNYSFEEKENENNISDIFKEIIDLIIFIDGITIEIIGSWVWIGGNTYPVKEQLKEAGFLFAPNKKLWYWHPGEFRKFKNKELSMDQIRKQYGSKIVNKNYDKRLNGFYSDRLVLKLNELKYALSNKIKINGFGEKYKNVSILKINGVIFNADEIVGKTLYLKAGKQAKLYNAIGGNKIYILQGGFVGVVYAYIQRPNEFYWMVERGNEKFFIKHEEGLFDVKALQNQGTLTTEEILKRKEEAEKSFSEKILDKSTDLFKKGFLIYLGFNLLSKLITR